MYIIKPLLLRTLDKECEEVEGMCFKSFLVIPHGKFVSLFKVLLALIRVLFQPLIRIIISNGMLLAVSKVHFN